MQAPWWSSKTETCRSDIYVYFNVNFNVFFKLIKVHLLVSELYIYHNARCNDKEINTGCLCLNTLAYVSKGLNMLYKEVGKACLLANTLRHTTTPVWNSFYRETLKAPIAKLRRPKRHVHLFCTITLCCLKNLSSLNPYPTAFPYGNGMVLHFYQQQESTTTKTVHKVINKWLKAYV